MIELERNTSIFNKFNNGERKCDLAQEFKLSRSRIDQIINEMQRIESVAHIEKQYNPFDLLSSRAKNCLHAAGLLSINDVEADLNENKLRKIYNMGKTTRAEVVAWLDKIKRQP